MTRVLVANRGEIAVRIIRSCRDTGAETVAVFSDADRAARHVELADFAYCIGPAPAQSSYLSIDALLSVALATGCTALHPGYGFLSETAALAKACADNDIVFVGPAAATIEAMGNKLTARQTAHRVGLPVVPGTLDALQMKDIDELQHSIGFPLLIKAAAGGGGRGIRPVRTAGDWLRAYQEAAVEATAAFGDGTLYAESFLPTVHHVEVQILGDGVSDYIHLGDRDCSVQRRRQKLIEEAPSPVVSHTVRSQMCDAAVELAREISYRGAGTVEFVVDPKSSEFFFIEMNTRIQVEHPVTEMITGVDVVREQLRIALGEGISLNQAQVHLAGHSVECRVNAEDPSRGFSASPGTLSKWFQPGGPGVRVDTHCYQGYDVGPFYDSLLAKLVVHGATRVDAIDRMRGALSEFRIEGLHTTIPVLESVLASEAFQTGQITTDWLEGNFLPKLIDGAVGVGDVGRRRPVLYAEIPDQN